jgi:hypothetical protein
MICVAGVDGMIIACFERIYGMGATFIAQRASQLCLLRLPREFAIHRGSSDRGRAAGRCHWGPRTEPEAVDLRGASLVRIV